MPRITSLCQQLSIFQNNHPKKATALKVTTVALVSISGMAFFGLFLTGSLSLIGGISGTPFLFQSLHSNLVSPVPIIMTIVGGTGLILHLMLPIGVVTFRKKMGCSHSESEEKHLETSLPAEEKPLPSEKESSTSSSKSVSPHKKRVKFNLEPELEQEEIEESSDEDRNEKHQQITAIFKRNKSEMWFKDEELTTLYSGKKEIEGFQLKRTPYKGKKRKKIRRVITGTLKPGGVNDLFIAHNYRKERMEVLRIPKADVEYADGLFDSGIPIHQRVSDLPHILKVYSVLGVTRGAFLEYCDKGNLEEAIKAKKYSLDLLLHLCAQTAESLAALHREKIIHGDIKPENLLLKSSKSSYSVKIRVADFDMAVKIGAKLDSVQGTFGYLPPEIKWGKMEVSPKLDTWAFGLVLFQVFCSIQDLPIKIYTSDLRVSSTATEEFWEQEFSKYIEDNLQSKEKELVDFKASKEIADLIRGLLAFDPEERLTLKEAVIRLRPWL